MLYETAAIVLHLCDTHPEPRAWRPPRGHAPQRAHFYKWLMWLTNTLQATLIVYFYPERWVDEGNAAGAAEVKAARAAAKVGGLLDQLDAELARHGGPWFMGESLQRAGCLRLHAVPLDAQLRDGPARERPHLGPYLQRMLARPAVQRVLANEGLQPPFV